MHAVQVSSQNSETLHLCTSSRTSAALLLSVNPNRLNVSVPWRTFRATSLDSAAHYRSTRTVFTCRIPRKSQVQKQEHVCHLYFLKANLKLTIFQHIVGNTCQHVWLGGISLHLWPQYRPSPVLLPLCKNRSIPSMLRCQSYQEDLGAKGCVSILPTCYASCGNEEAWFEMTLWIWSKEGLEMETVSNQLLHTSLQGWSVFYH